MEAIEKEVQRVVAKVPALYPEPLSSSSSSASSRASASKKATSSSGSVSDSLDGLLNNLQKIRSTLVNESPSSAVIAAEAKAAINASQKSIADRHKEVYNSLSKLGKAYDKKFPTPIDGISDPGLFMGAEPQKALEAVVLDHLLRMGEWDTAQQLAIDADLPLPDAEVYRQLEHISQCLQAGSLQPAIDWARANRSYLTEQRCDLEFALHRSQFLRIAIGQVTPSPDEPAAVDALPGIHDPDGEHVSSYSPPASDLLSPRDQAIGYGRTHFQPHVGTHLAQIQALFTFALYPIIPGPVPDPNADKASWANFVTVLQSQVHPAYWDFLDENLMHSPYLVPTFRAIFSSLHGLARDPPLSTAVEVGASGALTKILKVRKVMKMRGNEWSQADELPIDIPLPAHLQFHSTFTCPVSKEQATESNPPMMLVCGHVVCAESLMKLSRGQGRVKCPYCPTESTFGKARRLLF